MSSKNKAMEFLAIGQAITGLSISEMMEAAEMGLTPDMYRRYKETGELPSVRLVNDTEDADEQQQND